MRQGWVSGMWCNWCPVPCLLIHIEVFFWGGGSGVVGGCAGNVLEEDRGGVGTQKMCVVAGHQRVWCSPAVVCTGAAGIPTYMIPGSIAPLEAPPPARHTHAHTHTRTHTHTQLVGGAHWNDMRKIHVFWGAAPPEDLSGVLWGDFFWL